jgi:hypothetical protein
MHRCLILLALCSPCVGCGTVYDCICTCNKNNGTTYDEPFNDQCYSGSAVDLSLKIKAEGNCSQEASDVISGCICQKIPDSSCLGVVPE